MKKLMASLVLGLSLIVGGCNGNTGQVYDTEAIASSESKAEAARKALDNAKAGVIAATRTVVEYYQLGLISQGEAQGYGLKIEAANNTLNEGYDLLDLGKAVEAGERGEVVDFLMTEMLKQLAKIRQEAE